ncbi:mutator type transposase [Tanacetum coccineum]
MEELRSLNKEVYDWLKGIPPHHCARSHFSGRPHCDVLLNNMCEVLNKQLLDGRDKPIITCLEFIRQYLMKRIVIVQQLINKSNGPLTPNATKIFNNIKKEAAHITVLWNGGDLYQATVSWIPCQSKQVACIWTSQAMVKTRYTRNIGVSECYWLSTWQDMYRFKINPCNGPDMWKKSPSPITLTPPDYHTPVGRPPKKRKKSAAELYDGMVKKGKLSRAGKSLTCNKCGQVGHNQRSCKGQRGPTVNESQVNASARNSGQGANASARPTVNQSQASQASVNPSAPTASQSQTFVRPTPSLIPTKPSVMNTAPFLRPTAPFVTASPSAPSLRPTTPFVTPRFTKNTASRLSPIKKVAAKRGKGKNVKKELRSELLYVQNIVDANEISRLKVRHSVSCLKRNVEPPKEGQPSNTQAVQAVKAWKHSDFLCHNYVLNGLVDSLYNMYCKTTTAKELWESLERKYKTEDVGT